MSLFRAKRAVRSDLCQERRFLTGIPGVCKFVPLNRNLTPVAFLHAIESLVVTANQRHIKNDVTVS